MGDDNEIRQLIRRESENSLQRALSDAKVGKAYDFEHEFAKTRKNRSFIVVGATLVTILALGIAAFGFTRLIEQRTAATPVDVRAFEDLNLRDLLDTAKRNESDMEQAKVQLSQLDSDLAAGIQAADRDYTAAAESIRARNLSSAEENGRLQDAAAAADAKKRQLRAGYTPKAAKARTEMAAIQKRIDQYDQRLMDQAKKQQAILDNERRVFDIEKQKQADLYESRIADLSAARRRDVAALRQQKDDLAASLTARYNPIFDDSRSSALLSGWTAPNGNSDPATIPPYLESAGFLDAGASTRLDTSLANFRYLVAKLKAVPYINSVPAVLSRLEAEALGSINSYRQALSKAGTGLQERDVLIDQLKVSLERYRWAVAEYIRDNREGGYVLDPRDPAAIAVALNPDLPVVDGTAGYVVRGDKAVATVELFMKDGSVFARAVKLTSGESLKPFDTILVQTAPSAGN